MEQRESKNTTNASKIAIEQIYLSTDLIKQDVAGNYYSLATDYGYKFEYPMRWQSSPSNKKMIGLRHLRHIPSQHAFNITLFYIEDEGDKRFVNISVTVLPNNSLREILYEIKRQFDSSQPLGFTCYLDINFSNTTGYITIGITHVAGDGTRYQIAFAFHDDQGPSEFEEFLKFLNQSEEVINQLVASHFIENADAVVPTQLELRVNNVWDRETLFFHADFSTISHKLIGRNGDHYEKPNRWFQVSDNTPDFQIWFTTNGKNRITPYYSDFQLDLCFVLNIERSIV